MLGLVEPAIPKQDTVMREAIPAKLRLALILRYLATVRDFGGQEFTDAVLEYIPYVIYNWSENNESENTMSIGRTGFETRVLFAVSEKLNFTYRLMESPEQIWGLQWDENGKGIGLIATVLDGRADVAMSALFQTEESERYSHFSRPIRSDCLSIMTRPSSTIPLWTSVFKPFQLLVWGLLFLSCIVTGTVMHFLNNA
ncbi:unnamed protein product [Darwinula stevensoni]|uniref:Ionotropic glutamate receptor L-glutamate and glycine-binding domain-containing protein n=1 Tax=Darwinula stevensoni TaxID=69355 RepID=A0A7R9A481_9CRUS|nr:unnamed protein product [Darwinula stevensoni]CAG0882818.1 unnamed protein product [Darwinula stevensoni]